VKAPKVGTPDPEIKWWVYPPEMPTELIWAGIVGMIRPLVYPHAVPLPEMSARIWELGEAGLYGATTKQQFDAPQGLELRGIQPPKRKPVRLRGRTTYDDILFGLVRVELTNGYPYGMDPRFAKRLLMLGDEAFDAIIQYLRYNKNLFLLRNAIAVMANMRHKDVAKYLLHYLKRSRDWVVRLRALSGLARMGDTKCIPTLLGYARQDPTARGRGRRHLFYAAIYYALGQIGDRRASPVLLNLLKRLSIKDDREAEFLISVIPAVARIADKGNKKLILALKDTVRSLERRYRELKLAECSRQYGGQRGKEGWRFTPRPQILYYMAKIALAATGDPDAKDFLINRLRKKGLNYFPQTTYYVLIDVLPGLGAKDILKNIVMGQVGFNLDLYVRVHALKRLGEDADPQFLKRLVTTRTNPQALRAIALRILGDLRHEMARPFASRWLKRYINTPGAVPPGEAMLLTAAVRTLGKMGSAKPGTLIKVVKKAIKTGAYARRIGSNNLDITRASVSIHPPLLEFSLLELGRTGRPEAINALIEVLRGTGPGRAEAALILGAFDHDRVKEALLGALSDPDGWVRFCAYRSLCRITATKFTNPDYICHWVFGTSKKRREKVIEAWRQKLGKRDQKKG
jgi:HEAT repeat protein